MDRFTLIRSLTLSRCSVDLVEQILNRIEKSLLEKISISSCKRILGRRFSLTQHLLSAERYPLLRSINLKLCARGIVYLTDVEIPIQKLNQLEYFSLDKPSEIENLCHILYHSPNLHSLNTVLNNLTDSFLISTEITKSFLLSRLELTSSIIQISTLEYFLDHFPNLTFLYLDFSTRSSKLVDSKYWINLFEKMHRLKYVYIRMIIQLLETNLSHEQVRERVKLSERPLFFTRILINRMNTIRIIINGIK
jgi:hypothetical protein